MLSRRMFLPGLVSYWTYSVHPADVVHSRPVGLALYKRSNRKLVATPGAVPLRSAPPTSGIVNI
eukprot:6181723-Pleurochrysis_carterae.AAC.2